MRITRATGQLEEAHQTIQSHARVLEREAALKADMARAQREGSYLDSLLPSSDNLIDFPRDISVWAAQYSVDVGFSFVKEYSATTNAPGYTTFVLTGRGTLANIFNMLRQMEASHYLIDFSQYDFVSESESVYTLLINGQIFSR